MRWRATENARLSRFDSNFADKHSIRRRVDRLVATVEAWRNRHNDAGSASTDTDREFGVVGREFGVVGRAIDTYMDELVVARGNDT